MTPITHPKIASLAPAWAPFPGCSVIFDRFGAHLQPAGEKIENAGALHAVLADALKNGEGAALRGFGFCPLPASSYHCTIADLVHAGNVRRIARKRRGEYAEAFAAAAPAAALAERTAPLIARSGLIGLDLHELAFAVDRVVDRGGRVIVVELRPVAGADSSYAALVDARDRLADILSNELGLVLPAYEPHVSLGYFANRETAAGAGELVSALDRRVRRTVDGRAFSFGSPGLFLFHDMALFEPARA